MMNWRDIPGYDGKYQASESGEIRNAFTERALSQRLNKHGYLRVNLKHKGEMKTVEVHRLVALAFIDNPGNLLQVNHINEVKTDNRVQNLEWCSCEYNLAFGTRVERLQAHGAAAWGKPVRQIRNAKQIARYSSLGEAARATGLKATRISRACHGDRKSYAGFQWEFC